MIILGAAGKFGRRTRLSRTDAHKTGDQLPTVAEEGGRTRPTGGVKAIAELNPRRAFREYRSSVDGCALSGRAKARGSGLRQSPRLGRVRTI
jgi:hypothetical protein